MKEEEGTKSGFNLDSLSGEMSGMVLKADLQLCRCPDL
jgi:hypothetical protein